MADFPELATNEEWRGIMVRARKERSLTQAELGAQVGTSQAVISMIESGAVETSAFVVPISKKLKIPLPMHFEDEWQKNWHNLGRVLRAQDMESAEAALKIVEQLIRKAAPSEPPTTEPTRRDQNRK